MKRAFVLLIGLRLATTLQALAPNEWRFSQSLDVSAAGLVSASLPAETLDATRPGLDDVRVLDGAGNEVPYLIDRPMPRPQSAVRPGELRTELDSATTRISLTTGTKSSLKGVVLEAPSGIDFVKAVRIEGSPDGKGWREIAAGQPIFRMRGAQNLAVNFPEGGWDYLRLTIDDSRSPAVPFTGVLLNLAETRAPAVSAPITIKARDESLGVTRISLDMGASNLTVASLRIDASDPLFARAVTIAVPELTNDSIQEQTVYNGSIYRLDLNGKTEARLDIPIDAQIRSRNLIILIHNGDSAPLTINTIEAERRLARLVFLAREPGRYQLLSGNGQAPAPSYDLSAMGDRLKTVPATEVRPGPLVANAGYQAADALADVSVTGAQIDVSGWKFRRQMQVEKPGAQQVELDPDVLARAAPNLSDVRIVTEDHRQVPFLPERTSISRSLLLKATVSNDTKRPTFSRWSIKLPQAGIPITRVGCTAGSSLFQRDMRLLEDVTDERGDSYTHELGRASWKQLPNEANRDFVIQLDTLPKSDTLFLETSNGDNPAIELRDFRGYYPVTRLIFRTSKSTQPLWIFYGNPEAATPHYDVSLVADQLLHADRTPATLAMPENAGSATARITETLTGSSRYIFWGVLGVVVIGLLVVISRLLPKAS